MTDRSEEQTSPQHYSDVSQGNLLAVLKISQLQATIAQAKSRLMQLSRDTEAARKRVQAGRSTRFTQTEVEAVLRLVVLLEEENSQLRAISMLPVEIEKLRVELQAGSDPALHKLQAENAYLKAQLREALSRLAESSLNPNTSGTVELSLSIPRSAKVLKTQVHKVIPSASPPTKPVKPKPKMPVRGSLPARSSKGYSPTFLRLSKSKKTASVPRLCEDIFADCFPVDHEDLGL